MYYSISSEPPSNPEPGQVWMCPGMDHQHFVWFNNCWTICDYNEKDVEIAMIDDIIKTNRQKLEVEIDHGISPNDFDFFTFEMWLDRATPEELEAYNKLGQNFRVSTAYAKGLIEPEPEKDLDAEYDEYVRKHMEELCEWKTQEIMDDYEDELENKLLFDVLKHFDDGYENNR